VARVVLFLLLAIGGWWLFWSQGRPKNTTPRTRGRRADRSAAPMLQCAYCGVHFPVEDALNSRDGRHFCSLAHQQSALHADTE
jgi:hypothetical protein